ncbi:transforming growth factor beta-2 proprotein-like [Corticium candelabrum]|uniref:transforming growth factor beta-2 proprotein-like n=1 Tax=Corticium candelabrum TaxID=121492 RepID=UPI002E270A12|nr:transforming growth factor beta-2 proprotein-like [Corticium candelabrum]
MKLMTQKIFVLLAICVLSTYAATVSSSSSATFDHDMKVKAVERLILSKLMMTQPPAVTARQLQSVTQRSFNAYNMTVKMNARKMMKRKKDGGDQYYATTTVSSSVMELSGSVCGNKVESKFYQCNSDRLPTTNAAIKTALLQLYYNPLTARRQDIIISAYQLTESCTRRGGYNRILLDTKRLTCTRSDYVEFDITRAVKTWATRKSENYGIEVEVVSDGCNRSPYRYTTTPYSMYLQPNGSNVPLERRPTLFVTSDIGYSVYTTRGRRRRQTLDSRFCKSLHPKNTNCCIRDFKLNLKKDLDWDWIVQPKVINVNQCSGLCPPTWADDANHTQIINQFRTLNPAGSVAPCCTPKTFEDVEIMYFNGISRRPVMGTLSNMIVTSCVCA